MMVTFIKKLVGRMKSRVTILIELLIGHNAYSLIDPGNELIKERNK
jgi:uncharacterized Fe-S cluster-containing radical SAM superfamily enzyme